MCKGRRARVKPNTKQLGPYLSVGIIFDDFADGNGLTQFLDTDMAHDTLVNGVLGELELTTYNFIANVIDDCHGTDIIPESYCTHSILQGDLHCETPNARGEPRLEAEAQRKL